MSVTSQVAKTGPFLITALPQVIPVGFPFQELTDLIVYDSGPTATPYDPALELTLGSDYTVTGGGYNAANQMQNGSITVVSTGVNAVAVGDYLTIARNVPINQPDSFISTGPLTIANLEQSLDRQATISQELKNETTLSLRFPNNEFQDGTLLKDLRSGNLLGFDANGNLFYYTPSSGGGSTFYTAGNGLILSANEFSVNPNLTLSSILATSSQFINFKLQPELGYPTGGSVTLRFDLSTNVYIGLTVNANFTFGSMSTGAVLVVNLKNTTGGALSLTWPGTVNVTGNSLPTSLAPGQSVVIRAEAYGTNLTDVFVQCVSASSSVLVAETMTAMKNLTSLSNNQEITLLGYNNAGDGGGGAFYWDASSTEADNSGTIIQLSIGGTGRLKRIAASTFTGITQQTIFDVRWFGAIPDGASPIQSRVQLAYNAIPASGVGCLYFPSGSYVFTGQVNFKSGKSITVKGDGVASTRFVYATTAASMFDISDVIDMHDIAFINTIGSANGFVVMLCSGSRTRLRDLTFSSFYNIICVKLASTYCDVSNVFMDNIEGTQLWLEAVGGTVSNCSLTAGDSNGLTVTPCMVVTSAGGGPMTSLRVSHMSLKGSGPWTPYDGGTTKSVLLVTSGSGTINECMFTDIFIDTTSATGNQVNTIGALFDGVSGAGAYVMGGFVLSDFYINGGREGIRLDGVDVGGGKSVGGFCISNIYSLPESTYPGIRLRGVSSINVNGTLPRGNGGGIGVLIQAQGSNYTEDIWINGAQSAASPNATSVGVQVNGTLTRRISAMFSAWGVTSAPYSLTGGATKANGISFVWPDATGGMNFSGAVNQNV